MEGTDTLIFLEEVLIGKNFDPATGESKNKSLHLLLSSSPISIIRASGVIASRLRSQNKITEENHEIFSNYLKSLQSTTKPKSLPLKHRGFTQVFAKKTFSLIFGFTKLEKQVWKVQNKVFKALQSFSEQNQKSKKRKILASDTFWQIFEQKYSKTLKFIFSLLKSGKVIKGKYAKQKIKMRVLMQMFRYVTASLDTIAYCKWKIKLMEFNQCSQVFARGIETANKKIRLGILTTGLKTWQGFIRTLKNLKFNLLRRVFTQSETRYFYLKSKCLKVLHYPQLCHSRLMTCSDVPLSPLPFNLAKVLKSADLRLRCLLKTSFARFYFNSLLEETISEVDISKVIKRKRKIIVPSGRSSRMSSRKHSRSNSLSRTLKASTPTVLRPLVLAGETRYFFTKRMYFIRWKLIPKEESFSQEEHHHVIKRKKILSPRQVNQSMLAELEKTLDGITSKSIFLNAVSRNRKNQMLRLAGRQGMEKDVRRLIDEFVRIAEKKKSLSQSALSIWNYTSIRVNSIKNCNVWDLIQRWSRGKIQAYLNLWKAIIKTKSSKQTLSLTPKSETTPRARRGARGLTAWEARTPRGLLPTDMKPELTKHSQINQRIIKLAFRSFSKLGKIKLFLSFNDWKEKTEIFQAISTKVTRFIQVLNKSLKTSISKAKILKPAKHGKIETASKAFKIYEVLKTIQSHRKKFAIQKLLITKSKSQSQIKLKNMIKILRLKFSFRSKKLFHPLRIIKNADEVKKNLLRKLKLRLVSIIEKRKYFFSIWKLQIRSFKSFESESNLKSFKFLNSIEKPIKRLRFKYFAMIISSHEVKPKQLGIMKLVHVLKLSLRKSFNVFVDKKRNDYRVPVFQLIKICHRTLREGFNGAVKLPLFNNIGNSIREAFRIAFNKLKYRAKAFAILKKFQSAQLFAQVLIKSLSKLQSFRFYKWKNQDDVHKRLIARKYLFKIIYVTSLSEETAIWRWKYTIVNNIALNPKHSLVYKHLQVVQQNYQNRLLQFALFKLLMFSRLLTIPTASSPSVNSSFSKQPFLEECDNSLDPSQPSMFSFSSKITKDEALSINRNGAAEILGISLKSCLLRKLTWALACLECFSSKISSQEINYEDLVQQLNVLVYDKACLLEDNNSLRTHNEALIESLERTNEYCNSLSLMINEIQISKLVAHIRKMAEYPLFHAFMTLKLNQESLSSF